MPLSDSWGAVNTAMNNLHNRLRNVHVLRINLPGKCEKRGSSLNFNFYIGIYVVNLGEL